MTDKKKLIPDAKQYLGDSVYVDFDEDTSNIILTTNNGLTDSNRIELEQGVYNNFEFWYAWLKDKIKEINDKVDGITP